VVTVRGAVRGLASRAGRESSVLAAGALASAPAGSARVLAAEWDACTGVSLISEF